MKKLLFITAVFASLSAFAQDEEPIQWIPKHEFTFNIFGGLNLGSVTLPGQQSTTVTYTDAWNVEPAPFTWFGPDYNGAFHTKPGLSFGLGFGYIYHFNDHWAFQTGIDFALYKYHVYTTPDGPTDGTIYSGMLYKYSDAGVTHNLVNSFGYDGFTEDATLGSVQIPLMAQWSTPISEKHRFYVAAGATIGLNVYAKSKQHWTALRNGTTLDYPPQIASPADAISTTDLWGHAWQQAGRDSTVVVKMDKALIDVRASLEVGFRWALAPGWGLYTGIYADYGLLNAFLKKDYSLVEGAAGWVEDGSKTDPYSPYDKNAWQYHSIFNSTGIPIMYHEADYNQPRVPYDQRALAGNRYFGGPVHAGAVGVKLRLSFGKVKKQPKPASPIVNTVPEAAPAPAQAPEAAPVEVPDEIKRTMAELSVTLFAFDKFNLDAKAIAGLDKVITWLKENPDLLVQIDGHTDWDGSDEYNQKLSERRAKSVYDYFVQHGVKADRLRYKGYGESRPIATNETAEGRQQNRRVELTIIQ